MHLDNRSNLDSCALLRSKLSPKASEYNSTGVRTINGYWCEVSERAWYLWRNHRDNASSHGTNGYAPASCKLPSNLTRRMALTVRGNWQISLCSAPYGANKMNTIYFQTYCSTSYAVHLETEQQSKFLSTKQTRGRTQEGVPPTWSAGDFLSLVVKPMQGTVVQEDTLGRLFAVHLGVSPFCTVGLIRKEWQDARANRIMQFKVGDFKDSNIRMLTGTLKADWIQLPVERYLAALPTLKQGVSPKEDEKIYVRVKHAETHDGLSFSRSQMFCTSMWPVEIRS